MFFCGPTFAQPPDLKTAVDAREAALDKGDDQAWSRLTTDDFLQINGQGEVKTKSQRMAEIKGNKRGSAAKTTDMKFRTYGDTIIQTWRAEATPAARLSQVWVKQNGQWKVATVQVSVLAKP